MSEKIGEPTLCWDDFVKLIEGPENDQDDWEKQTGLSLKEEYTKHREGANASKVLAKVLGSCEKVVILRVETDDAEEDAPTIN